MKARRSIAAAILVLVLAQMACNLPSNQTATPDPYEAAALTVTALAGTEQAGLPSPTITFTAAPPTAMSTATSAPPLTVVAQASATPGGTFFVVDIGANCRTGPATNYDRIASFAQATYLTPIGRNTDSTWWYIQVWVSGSQTG